MLRSSRPDGHSQVAATLRWLGCLGLVLLTTSSASGQTGTLFVEGDNVGIGTPTPEEALEVESADGTARILVDENGPSAWRELLLLKNNGPVQMLFRNEDHSKAWRSGIGGFSHYIISRVGSGQVEFELERDGDLNISGQLNTGSSRDLKKDLVEIDGGKVLDQISSLPILEWSYRASEPEARHVGPVAEDFHSLFGLGQDPRYIAPYDLAGVALAGVKGLRERLEEREAKIRELEHQNGLLIQRLEELEQRIGNLEEQP